MPTLSTSQSHRPSYLVVRNKQRPVNHFVQQWTGAVSTVGSDGSSWHQPGCRGAWPASPSSSLKWTGKAAGLILPCPTSMDPSWCLLDWGAGAHVRVPSTLCWSSGRGGGMPGHQPMWPREVKVAGRVFNPVHGIKKIKICHSSVECGMSLRPWDATIPQIRHIHNGHFYLGSVMPVCFTKL